MSYILSIAISTRNEAGQMRSISRDKLCEASQRAITKEKEKLAALAERIARMEAKQVERDTKEMAKAVAAASAVPTGRPGRPVGYKCNPDTVRKMVEGRLATLAARKAVVHAPHVGA